MSGLAGKETYHDIIASYSALARVLKSSLALLLSFHAVSRCLALRT